jgi:hypothetical protein
VAKKMWEFFWFAKATVDGADLPDRSKTGKQVADDPPSQRFGVASTPVTTEGNNRGLHR